MKKKKCAIVFGITDNYTFALCNVLLGMKKHCEYFWDDLIVFHTDVSDQNQQVANKILKCEFIKVEDDAWCERVSKKVSSEVVSMYSIATMFRYCCFDLLKTYHKVIWSDCDLLIQGDFSSMLKYADKTGYAACISDNFAPLAMNFKKAIPGYSMYTPNYNGGTLVLSDKLANHEKMCQWCKDKTVEYADVLDMPDQGILNLMIQEFNIEPEVIDAVAYQCHPEWPEALNKAKSPIIHAYGSRKFWNDKKYKSLFPEWEELNQEYKNIATNTLGYIVDDTPSEAKVSVLMSVFDRYEFLAEAVESILEQTYENLELIVVVEKSLAQKSVVQILLSYDDDRIVIIENETKLGFAASLNRGLDAAKGSYIARMDDDDISYLQRLEKQVNFMENNKDIGIVGTYAETFMKRNDVWDTYPTDPDMAKIELLKGTVLCHPSVLMRASELKKFDLKYDTNVFAEDYDLWARAAEYIRISNIPEILFKYRSSGQNITLTGQHKVHAAHLQIMKNQLKKYLGIDATPDELSLLNGRINILEHTYTKNLPEALVTLNELKKKIAVANEQTNFYDQSKLERFFLVEKTAKLETKKVAISFTAGVKKVFTKIFKPISDLVVWVFSYRTYDLINGRADSTNGLINGRADSTNGLINEHANSTSDLIKEHANNTIELVSERIDKMSTLINELRSETRAISERNGILYEGSKRESEARVNKNIAVAIDKVEHRQGVDKRTLFVNNTLNSYHHGSSATSLAIYMKIEQTGAVIDSIHLLDTYNTSSFASTKEYFLSDEFFYIWALENRLFAEQIKMADTVVVNGEGCLSHYNPNTLKLLYLIYAASKRYNKKVLVVNTSLFFEDLVNKWTPAESAEFKGILSETMASVADLCVREPKSFKQAELLVPGKARLTFDSLPLYAEIFMKTHSKTKNPKYLIVTGGSYLPKWYLEFVTAVLPMAQEKTDTRKIVFLVSDVQIKEQTGDFTLYEHLASLLPNIDIEKRQVNSTDEWLECIQGAALLISGRFHHSIAAFMLDTPFLAFRAGTEKIDGALELMRQQSRLLENKNKNSAILKAKELLSDVDFYKPFDLDVKREVIQLGERNFDNI